jgi:hypothetical protein
MRHDTEPIIIIIIKLLWTFIPQPLWAYRHGYDDATFQVVNNTNWVHSDLPAPIVYE